MTARRDWPTAAGLTVVGTSTVIASFSALAGLAGHAGWHWPMSLLLPATVDVYGVTATRIWLAPSSSDEVRSHARAHAFGALALSMAGNALNHSMDAGALALGHKLWVLVVAVSLVPPVALGALMHLVTVRSKDRALEPVTADLPVTQVSDLAGADDTAPPVAWATPQVTDPVPQDPGGPAPAEPVTQTAPKSPSKSPAAAATKSPAKAQRSDEEVIADLNKIVAEHYRQHPGEEIKVKPVAQQLGIGRDRARRLLDEMNVRPMIRRTG